MMKHPDRLCSRAAFTLIEILTAMMLVAVLMLAIFPGLRAAHANAKRHTAAVEAFEIASAAMAYRQVYGIWPCEDDDNVNGAAPGHIITAGATKLSGEGFSDGYNRDIGKIIDVLRCGLTTNSDRDKYNRKGIVFLELPDSCFYAQKGNDAENFYPYDPWGRPYVMMMARQTNEQVSRIEGGIHEVIPRNSYDVNGIITATDDVVVFSWGDLEGTPRNSTQTNGIPLIVGSWSTR